MKPDQRSLFRNSFFIMVCSLAVWSCSRPGNLYRAAEMYLQKDYKNAMDETDRYLRNHKQDSFALLLKGDIYRAQMDYSNAVKYLIMATNAGLYADDTLCCNIGEALFKLGKTDSAIVYFQKAIKINEKNPRYYYNLSLALHTQGRYNEVLPLGWRMRAIKPAFSEETIKFTFILGDAYLQLDELDSALTYFKEYQKMAPDVPNGFIKTAAVYYGMDELDLAMDEANKAIEIDSTHPECYGIRYFIWNDLGEREKAIQDSLLELKYSSPEYLEYSK